MARRIFVLDANFPWALLHVDWPADIEVVPLGRLYPDLIDEQDPRLLLELHRRGCVAGLITNDAGMLSQAKHLVALSATTLTLVVPSRHGHSPLIATGMVLTHIQDVASRWTAHPTVAKITKAGVTFSKVNTYLNEIARHEGLSRFQRVQKYRDDPDVSLSPEEAIHAVDDDD